jgi:hypothetical protein
MRYNNENSNNNFQSNESLKMNGPCGKGGIMKIMKNMKREKKKDGRGDMMSDDDDIDDRFESLPPY